MTEELPSYPGITPQKNGTRIEFEYKGMRCRETIRGIPNKSRLQQAHQMRQAILFGIDTGQFDYAKYFPNSKNALKYAKNPSTLITVKQALKDYIIRKRSECQLSTVRDYEQSIHKYLLPKFGDHTLDQIKPTEIKNWLSTLPLSNKRKNNILVPLRGVFDDAYHDEIIERNPMERVKSLPVTQQEPNPFSLSEIELLLNQFEGQVRNYFQFAFWTGLRTSELIGLQWGDVDLDRKVVHIRRAIVKGREKTTKTKSGIRTLELTEKAEEALRNQEPHTKGLNHWVFHDPKHNTRWKNENPMRKRYWLPAIEKAGIQYRNPYQTRHTFASQMLSQGKNPMWVAQQMGHSDWGMIRKTYGRWIGA